jgi:hypothetical protein
MLATIVWRRISITGTRKDRPWEFPGASCASLSQSSAKRNQNALSMAFRRGVDQLSPLTSRPAARQTDPADLEGFCDFRGPEALRLHGTHLGTHLGSWEPPATVLPRISRTYMAGARPNGGTR